MELEQILYNYKYSWINAGFLMRILKGEMVVDTENIYKPPHELALDLEIEQKSATKPVELLCNCPKCGFKFVKNTKKGTKKSD